MTLPTLLAPFAISPETLFWATVWAQGLHALALAVLLESTPTERPPTRHRAHAAVVVGWLGLAMAYAGAVLWLDAQGARQRPSPFVLGEQVPCILLALAAHSLAYAWVWRSRYAALAGLLLGLLGGWLG